MEASSESIKKKPKFENLVKKDKKMSIKRTGSVNDEYKPRNLLKSLTLESNIDSISNYKSGSIKNKPKIVNIMRKDNQISTKRNGSVDDESQPRNLLKPLRLEIDIDLISNDESNTRIIGFEIVLSISLVSLLTYLTILSANQIFLRKVQVQSEWKTESKLFVDKGKKLGTCRDLVSMGAVGARVPAGF